MKIEGALNKITESTKEESIMTIKEETLEKYITGGAQKYIDPKIQEETQKEVTVKDETPETSVTPVQSVSEDNIKSETVEQSEEVETSSDEEIVTQPDICDSDIDISKACPAPKSDEELEDDTEEDSDDPNKNLPQITPDDKRVILCTKEGYRLEMVPVYNADNMVVEKCKLFLVNEADNVPMIGAGTEIQVGKEKIMTAEDYNVLYMIKKFVINFEENDIKLAFERARKFLETSRSMLALNNSLNIIDAYREVVRRAIKMSKSEDNATDGKNTEGRRCKYDPENKMVSIRDSYMKEIMEDTGYTPVTFCKKLCLAGVSLGVSFLKCSKGRYAYNETGNQRFYKLYVVDEYMVESEVA